MEIRLLENKDFDQIEKIYFDSFYAERKRKEIKGQEVEQDYERLAVKDEAWFESIKKFYLNPDDKNHLMWGAFEEDNLSVYFCVRLNLPGAWNDGFVISWMKGDPTVNNMTNGSLGKMYDVVYEYAESIGKKKWYWIVEQDRYKKFNAFAKRYTPFVDERYESFTLCTIPPGAKPEIDWVWSMIGRSVSRYENYIVRAGILKDEFIRKVT